MARRLASARRATNANRPRPPSTFRACTSRHMHADAPEVPPGFEAFAACRRAEELAKNEKAEKVDYIEEFNWVREVRVFPQ